MRPTHLMEGNLLSSKSTERTSKNAFMETLKIMFYWMFGYQGLARLTLYYFSPLLNVGNWHECLQSLRHSAFSVGTGQMLLFLESPQTKLEFSKSNLAWKKEKREREEEKKERIEKKRKKKHENGDMGRIFNNTNQLYGDTIYILKYPHLCHRCGPKKDKKKIVSILCRVLTNMYNHTIKIWIFPSPLKTPTSFSKSLISC